MTTIEKVRAPKTGYATDEKAKYREDVWSALGPIALEIMTDPRAYCLIMPSREGLEIDVAVKHGIPPEKIVCVDQSAAVIATSSWRKKWPQCRFFASKVSEIGAKLKKNNMRLAAANLDLCGNFSDETISEIDGFLLSAPTCKTYALAVTMMRGREGSIASRMLDRCDASYFQEKRLNGLFAETALQNNSWQFLAEGAYRSGKMPVAWMAIRRFDAAHLMNELQKQVRYNAAIETRILELWDKGNPSIYDGIAAMQKRMLDYNKYTQLLKELNSGMEETGNRLYAATDHLINAEITRRKVLSEIMALHREERGDTTIDHVRKTARGWGASV